MKKAKRTLGVYRSYNFTDFDPVIDKVRTIVQDANTTYKKIHEDSGVSRTTMSNWFNGKTRRPQFATVNAVARALGQEFRLAPMSMTPTGVAKRKKPRLAAHPVELRA